MRLVQLPLAALLVASLCSSSPLMKETKERELDDAEYRLPNLLKPSNYKLELTPYLKDEGDHKQFTFDGKCTITFTAEQNVSEIVLHRSEEMQIDEKKTKLKNGTDGLKIVKSNYDDKTEFYTLTVKGGLVKGQIYTIYFEYVGYMNDQMSGFYRSSYEEDGKTKWIATTQFQPTHARKAFPCFDEPKFKATFDVSIIREKDMHTLGNMVHKVKNQVVLSDNNRVKDTFETTPIMSAYILAFVVSQFENVSQKEDRQLFDVWARPQARTQGQYSYDVGQETLKVLEEFTNYTYKTQGMSKMDMIALPDFAAGAMENWGLLTFRETSLLYDAKVSTELAKQRVATVVAHEQAHMWFGDLVTCDWWEHTWLNEGFARYLQYFITDKVEPKWNLMEQFIIEQQQTVFGMDALTTSKALSSSVGSPGSITAHFDSISYNKGASVIKMMEHMIGSETFKKALQKYLQANQFKTVVPDNLFEALQKQADEDKKLDGDIKIKDVMKNWVYEIGYPVINIKQSDENLIVTQKRFLLHPAPNEKDLKYYVPLSYTSKSEKNFGTKPKAFIKDNQERIQLKLKKTDGYEWVIFNIKGTGYYRVNYDEQTWKLLTEALKEKNFDGIVTLNRAQLIDDAFNLARAEGKLLKYDTTLNLIDYLEEETEYLPWTAAFQGLGYLFNRLNAKDEDRVELEVYINHLMKKLYEKHGFTEKPDENPVMKYNRAQALSWACKVGNEDCINNSKALFEKYRKNNEPVSPNLRPTVYCTALRHGNETDFDHLWNNYLTENVAAEQVLILTALGCTKSEKKLKWYLEESIKDDSKIRKQDASSVFTGVYSGNPANVRIAFDFLKDKYEKISTAYAGMNALGNAISGLAARLTTKEEVAELKEFLDSHASDMGNAAETAAKAIEAAQTDLKWNESHGNEILTWIRATNKRKNGSPTIAASFIMCIIAVAVSLQF